MLFKSVVLSSGWIVRAPMERTISPGRSENARAYYMAVETMAHESEWHEGIVLPMRNDTCQRSMYNKV